MSGSLRGPSALLLGVMLSGLAFSGGAQAQTLPMLSGENTKIGMGMICNSKEQAARFIELRAGGRKADAAMAAVNKEWKDKQGCGLATIAFTQDATLDSRPVDNQLVQVVRINVVAGFTGKNWFPMSNFVQYAVVEAEGIAI